MVDVNQDEETGSVSLTLKAGQGYEAPWIVVRGADAEDVLKKIGDETFEALVQVGATLAADFVQQWSNEKQARGAGTSGAVQRTQAAVGGDANPEVVAKKCVHGDMVYRTGNKNGRNWAAWFCPTPKGTPGQCKPEFEGN